MSGWLWIGVGFALLVVELLTPGGFFVLFFGLGAILTGVLAELGVTTSTGPQWLVFTLSSVGSLAFFRKRLQARFEQSAPGVPVDSLVGETATPIADIPPHGVGRVSLRGSSWEARNESDAPLTVNQRCRVVRVSGLQVGVVAES